MTRRDLDLFRDVIGHDDGIAPHHFKDFERLFSEVDRLRQVLGEYGEHHAWCPKHYVQEHFCAALKTEGKCECGLDEELGLPTAEPTAAKAGGREEG